MQVVLADVMGTCKGLRLINHRVSRTIKQYRDVYIYNELVHNNQATEQWLQSGVRGQINQVSEIPNKATIIVGPHSAPPSTLRKIAQSTTLIDTTCKDVKKVLNCSLDLSRRGYCIVFVGRKNHEEAITITDEIPGSIVISTIDEVKELSENKVYGIVSQSTQPRKQFLRIAEAILLRYPNSIIEDTVCAEIEIRLKAAEKLAKQVDYVIVVGGFHSSNTQALVNICNQFTNVKHLETADQIDITSLQNLRSIGITAGASTPDWVVEQVIDKVTTIARSKESRKFHPNNRIFQSARIKLWLLRMHSYDKLMSLVSRLVFHFK